MWKGLIMNRRTLFVANYFRKAGFVVKSCFLYTKLGCRNDGKKLMWLIQLQCKFTHFICFFVVFFSIKDFFHEHSQFTGQQEKCEAMSLFPLYHFYLLYRHLKIGQVVTAGSSPLRIASSRHETRNFWFPSANR